MDSDLRVTAARLAGADDAELARQVIEPACESPYATCP
jgi:hypothetical protein